MPTHSIPQPVLRHADLPQACLPGLAHCTLADQAHGLRQLSVWQQTLAPGAATPPHRHDAEEVVLCHSGQGELHLQGTVHCFGPGTSVLVPRNAPHQIVNVGSEPMHITAAFAAARVEVFGPDDQPIALPW